MAPSSGTDTRPNPRDPLDIDDSCSDYIAMHKVWKVKLQRTQFLRGRQLVENSKPCLLSPVAESNASQLEIFERSRRTPQHFNQVDHSYRNTDEFQRL